MGNLFFGTKRHFKILYYITAMSPAYLLFSLQLFEFNDVGVYSNSQYKFPWLTILILILSFLLTYIIKSNLIYSTRLGENTYSIDFNVDRTIQINGNVVSFFAGVILPVIFYMKESVVISILVFIGIQIMVYVLVSKSDTIFPNILLLLVGLNIYTLESGKYLISNLSVYELSKVRIDTERVGDNSNLLSYVIRKGESR